MKIISHPTVRVGSHSFSMPYYILVHVNQQDAISAPVSTTYKYPRLKPLKRLAVKNISHPTLRVGNHSSSMPYYILVCVHVDLNKSAPPIAKHERYQQIFICSAPAISYRSKFKRITKYLAQQPLASYNQQPCLFAYSTSLLAPSRAVFNWYLTHG